MTSIDKNQSPYYDDYSTSKNYSQILAVPGRVEQAREFTQMQTMIYDYLQRLSDTLLSNGAIVSGMGFVLKNSTILVESGKVYINGKIHNFEQQEIAITRVGEEVIGVKLIESIITEDQDISLLDPTTSTGNYGQPGSHRIKNQVVLTVNSDSGATLYEFFDGGLQAEVPRPQFDGLQDLLARRTYDESGNYKVRGLELMVEPYDANNVRVIVEAGTAYVKGYQLIKPTPVKIIVPMAKDSRPVAGEPKTYATGTTRYALNNSPAKAISEVKAYIQVSQNMSRGSTPGGIDYLENTPVVDIISVIAGGTTYVKGTSFKLTGNGIDWSLAGAEPVSGTSYTVLYWFNKTLVQGADYVQYQEIGDFGETKDYLDFKAGDKPVNNSTFFIDYEYYLDRIDTISINKTGEISVARGQSDIPRNVKAPVVDSPDSLHLGAVYLPANSGNAKPTLNSDTRLDMQQIQKVARRIEDIEFNQAISALDREALDSEIATELQGIFSDSFRSTVRADLTNPNFTAMYDLDEGNLLIPILSTKITTPVVSNPSSVKQFFHMATAPMTEKVSISQNNATSTMLVNPYLAFMSIGVLNVVPQVDNWIDDTLIQIESTSARARDFWGWWGNTSRTSELFGVQIDDGAQWDTTANNSARTLRTSILSQAITNMRQTTVSVIGTNFHPGTDKLECYFDGVRVALTPSPGFVAGTVAGTIKANASGEVKATFTVPPNIRTGTREVKLINASNTGTTSYTSIGTRRTIFNTVRPAPPVDPLAQTFQFDKDTMLTSVGAYFSAKDDENAIVQIRNVVNGYPGNLIFQEKVLTPSQILVSDKANIETKITFDDPIMCSSGQQYCVVFVTDSAKQAMYICDLGKDDVETGVQVIRQPYLAGMLFSSKNGLAWTAHQNANMKFKIYEASFSGTTTIDFDTQTSMNSDRLLLLVDVQVPVGTSCTWQVSLDSGAYRPIMEYNDLDLLKVASTAKLRAVVTTNGSVSPIIAMDSIKLIGFTTGLTGSYIGRNVEFTQPLATVKQSFEASIPSGCTVTPQYSYDLGATWRTSTQVSSQPISAEFTRYVCEDTIPNGVNALNYKARLNISSNSPILRPRARKFINIMK